MQEYVMGNGAIALGALAAGVNLVSGYPGTPSSEIVETISKYPHDGVHLEWSVNEKAAMEVAASAAYGGSECGSRSADVACVRGRKGRYGRCIS